MFRSIAKSLRCSPRDNRVVTLTLLVLTFSVHGCELWICKHVHQLALTQIPLVVSTHFDGCIIRNTQMTRQHLQSIALSWQHPTSQAGHTADEAPRTEMRATESMDKNVKTRTSTHCPTHISTSRSTASLMRIQKCSPCFVEENKAREISLDTLC